MLLILISTTALVILEYNMFYNDMVSDVEGSFTFGKEKPNWLDTFFHTLGGLWSPLQLSDMEMLVQLLI